MQRLAWTCLPARSEIHCFASSQVLFSALSANGSVAAPDVNIENAKDAQETGLAATLDELIRLGDELLGEDPVRQSGIVGDLLRLRVPRDLSWRARNVVSVGNSNRLDLLRGGSSENRSRSPSGGAARKSAAILYSQGMGDYASPSSSESRELCGAAYSRVVTELSDRTMDPHSSAAPARAARVITGSLEDRKLGKGSSKWDMRAWVRKREESWRASWLT